MSEIAQSKIRIGISGKRNILSDIYVREEMKKSISNILKKEKTKSFTAYSAMAKGADTIFADVVNREFNQDIKIVLPFDSTEYEKDFTKSADLTEYKNWISKIGISEVVTLDIPKTQERRNEAYFVVGKFITDTCDYMIIIWDEQKPNGKGGTAEILGYASQCATLKGIDIITVQPDQNDEINIEINSLQNASDDRAIRLKRKYETIWIVSIIFGWLTALCFSATLSFYFSISEKLMFSSIELAFIFTVFILIRIIKKQQLHPNLLKERLRAEKLRLLAVYYHTDLPITISEITQKDDEKLADVGEKVNAASSCSYQSKWYKCYVLRTLIEGQIKYHHNLSENVIGDIPKKLKSLNSTIYIIWLILLISHFFSLLFTSLNIYIPILSDYPYPDEIGRFLLVGLPATYAGFEGFLFFKEWENFKKQSSSMIKILNEEKKQLEDCKSSNDDFLQILNRVSIAMLSDNQNWRSLLSKKETPHPIL